MPAFSDDLRRGFFPKPIDVLCEFVYRAEFQTFASINLIQSLPHGATQPFQFGPIFLLPAFHEPKPFAYDFTGVTIKTGSNFGLNEVVEVVRQVDVSCRHKALDPMLAALAKIAN
jgi:hypothetical protein